MLAHFCCYSKIRSNKGTGNEKVSTEQESSVRLVKSQRKTSWYFTLPCLTCKINLIEWYKMFFQNFFICSQFRLEENFFKARAVQSAMPTMIKNRIKINAEAILEHLHLKNLLRRLGQSDFVLTKSIFLPIFPLWIAHFL